MAGLSFRFASLQGLLNRDNDVPVRPLPTRWDTDSTSNRRSSSNQSYLLILTSQGFSLIQLLGRSPNWVRLSPLRVLPKEIGVGTGSSLGSSPMRLLTSKCFLNQVPDFSHRKWKHCRSAAARQWWALRIHPWNNQFRQLLRQNLERMRPAKGCWIAGRKPTQGWVIYWLSLLFQKRKSLPTRC